MNMPISWERIRNWGIKGGLSILDQGIYSSANFISIILLARWQPPQDYGAFSVAFATFLFLSGIYNGLILEPISILGPSVFAEDKEAYFASQLQIHFIITIPLAVIFGLCMIVINNEMLRYSFLWASLALPFMLLTWLARRTYYANHQPFGAFICSLLYAFALLVGLALVLKFGKVTIAVIFMIMSIAGIAGGIALLWWGIQHKKSQGFQRISILKVLGAHWNLGKWIVFAAIFSLAAEQAPIFFLANLRGLGEAAAFKAVQNFVQPIVQVEAALSLMALPVLAREYSMNNISSFRRIVLLLATAMTSMAAIYEMAIWVTSDQLEYLAYRGQYTAYSNIIAFYGLIPILIGLFTSFFIAIRAIQRTKIYLINGIVSFVVGIPSTYFLTKSYGLIGAISGLILAYLIIFISDLYLYFNWAPKVNAIRRNANVNP